MARVQKNAEKIFSLKTNRTLKSTRLEYFRSLKGSNFEDYRLLKCSNLAIG